MEAPTAPPSSRQRGGGVALGAWRSLPGPANGKVERREQICSVFRGRAKYPVRAAQRALGGTRLSGGRSTLAPKWKGRVCASFSSSRNNCGKVSCQSRKLDEIPVLA